MKKRICALLCFLLLCGMTACGGTRSHYRAIGFVHSTDSRHLEMRFFKLSGTLVHTLRVRDVEEGSLHYSGSLETGTVSVYIERADGRELLFSLQAGESVDAHGSYIEDGDRVRLVIEAQDANEGALHVCFAE